MKNERKKTLFTAIAYTVLSIPYILLVILFFWLLTSCTKEDDEPVIVNKVLLVYLAGDNNLSGESNEKLEAIRQGWDGNPATRILIYHDATDVVPRLLEVTSDNSIETLAKYQTEDSADPQVFHRVISQSKALYPQAKFNLLVFSHASGWLPDNTLVAPKSAVQTKTILADGNNSMELADFAAAIPDKAFNYIIFETCFMTGIEVAYQLRNKADYIAASSAEIVSPGFTSIYSQHINELVSGAPEKFMQEAFVYFDDQSGWMRSATFSIIRTDKLEPLTGYVKANCDFTRQVPITDIQYFDRNNYHLFADFGDYYSRLLQTDRQKEQLQQLIVDAVVWKAATPDFMQGYNGFVIDKHSGITTYIMQERYPVLNANYTTLDWYKAIRPD